MRVFARAPSLGPKVIAPVVVESRFAASVATRHRISCGRPPGLAK